MEYCRRCGGPLDTVQILAKPRGRCSRCGHVEYRDLAVAAATVTEVAAGQVVLARRAIRPGYGLWVIPGGFVEAGETVATAAIRETAEEVGIRVRLVRLVGVYSYPRSRVAVVVYHAIPEGPDAPAPQDGESFEARGFHQGEVPWDDLAFDSTRDALRDFFAPVSPD
ncbi:MAG: NUDIX hydrolase [Thermaerobacter sp.]|nr:NUDIX hydrolase [Thermaerobacter sp.]